MSKYMKADAIQVVGLAQGLGAATLYLLAIAAMMHQVAQAAGYA